MPSLTYTIILSKPSVSTRVGAWFRRFRRTIRRAVGF